MTLYNGPKRIPHSEMQMLHRHKRFELERLRIQDTLECADQLVCNYLSRPINLRNLQAENPPSPIDFKIANSAGEFISAGNEILACLDRCYPEPEQFPKEVLCAAVNTIDASLCILAHFALTLLRTNPPDSVTKEERQQLLGKCKMAFEGNMPNSKWVLYSKNLLEALHIALKTPNHEARTLTGFDHHDIAATANHDQVK